MDKNRLRETNGLPEVVVSMTSFPARIKTVHQALQSVIDQIVKPDRIVLCLARDEFPGGREDLPPELLRVIDHGVELLWAEHNLKPHKKYFYTMRKYPDAIIITADDDKVYPQSFVGELVASYRRFPKCVSAFRAHLMTFGPDGEVLPYLRWKNSCAYFINRPNLALFAVGAGGILYPPHLLHENLFDKDGLLSTTLNNDDIWLKIMEVANRIPVVIPSAAGDRAVTIEGSQESALYNANKNGNDGMIRAAWNYFSEAFCGSVSEIIREGRLAPVPEDIDHAISECHEVQQLLSVQKSRANKAIAEYYAVQEQLKQEKDHTARLTADMAQCVQEKNGLARTNESISVEVAKLREQLDRVAAECAELAKGKAAAEAEVARQREQLDQEAAERMELVKCMAAVEAEVARQREQLDQTAAECAKLAKGKAAVEAEAARQRAQCVKLEDGNRTLSDRLAVLTKKANRAASDYAKMKNWYQRVQQKYEKLSKAKLGRLTLIYWKLKDRIKATVGYKALNKANSDKAVPSTESGASVGQAVRSPQQAVSSATMNVLFPCGSGNGAGQNPFVGVLMQSLRKCGVNCDADARLFWESDIHYDIVNIMWPEALWGWNSATMPKAAICKLAKRLDELKLAGTRIVYTRHNIRPHVDNASALLAAYSLIEASADVVIHMGTFSKDELLRRLPNSSSAHVIIPHHVYPRILRSVSRKEARARFGFSDQDKVILSFGIFRTDAERQLLMDAVRDCGLSGLRVLAPRFSDSPPPEVKGCLDGRAVPESMLPLYFAAADVVFLQRTNILNSGNLPMAYYFGRACVGPRVGNVGEILEATGNFTFDPSDRKSVSLVVRKALDDSATVAEIGKKNQAYADSHWHPDQIAQQVLAAYREAKRRNVRVPDVATLPQDGEGADLPSSGVSMVVRSKGDSTLLRRTLQSIEEQDFPRAAIEVITDLTWEKGLAKVTKPLVMLLQEGDRITRGFLQDLNPCFCDECTWVAVGQWATSGNTVTSGPFFTSKVAARLPVDGTASHTALMPLMASAFGRIFRVNRFREYQKELLTFTECETDFSAVGRLIDWNGHLAMTRSGAREFYQPGGYCGSQTIVAEIEKLSGKIIAEDVSVSVKRMLAGRIQFLSDRLYLSVLHASESERARLVAQIDRLARATPFFNSSRYAAKKAIAFCHNFPPAVDASSFVSSKRLREIDALEKTPLQWHVIAQDMSALRPQDFDFPTFFSDFQMTSISVMRQKVGWAPVLQKPYVDAACQSAESIDAEVIFSRAFWIGSHMAAYQYKLKHPRVKWYAEFSDPVAYAVDNTVRACPNKGPNWFETEQMVYDLADVILFTNVKQRDYMLAYHPNQEKVPEILRRSVVLQQPILDHAFCNIVSYDYSLDAGKINIAFFGTFYVNRKGDDLLALLGNPDVVLHVFTTKPEEFDDKVREFKGRLRVNPTISHLEFLNLGSRFDYLFLNDATFVGGVNPFLPSKFADYKATQTPIIAKVQEGSTLSEIDDPLVIKVTSISPDFVATLHRRSESC